MMQDLLNTYLLRHCLEKIADRLATVIIVKRFVLCNVLPKRRFEKFEKGYAPGLLCDGTFCNPMLQNAPPIPWNVFTEVPLPSTV